MTYQDFIPSPDRVRMRNRQNPSSMIPFEGIARDEAVEQLAPGRDFVGAPELATLQDAHAQLKEDLKAAANKSKKELKERASKARALLKEHGTELAADVRLKLEALVRSAEEGGREAETRAVNRVRRQAQ